MISKDELMRLAGKQKINPSPLGKDYALGWLLFGISKSSVADRLVLKGGTALSKIYFPEDWRLSEDLDFTVTDKEIELKSIINALENEVPKIVQKKNEMTVVLKDRPHTNIGYLQSRFQYTGSLGKDTIKIEISKEGVVGKIKTETVPRVFDYPAFKVCVYSLEDILAEKMRSIIQRTRIRDYYDVWRLLKVRKFDNKKVKELFLKKCESKVQFTSVDQFFPSGISQILGPYLQRGLTRLSREPLPPIEEILKELKELLNKFFK